MKNVPDLSILIVSYNTRDTLLACLESVYAQAAEVSFEVIVIDNHSQDGSADAVARKFPSVELLRSEQNLGFANANNRALKEASGRYIVLLNPDALLSGNVLRMAMAHMDEDATVGMAGARLIAPDGAWQPSARQFPSLLNEFLNLSGLSARFPRSRFFGRFDRTWADASESADVDWVPGAFAIIRRDVIDQLGLFAPAFFLYYEEVDLCRRIHAQGYRVCYWSDLVVTHMGGESSKTVTHVDFDNSGKQLGPWRMRSQLLYYRKWHGYWGAQCVKWLEQSWHFVRAWKNRHSSPGKAAESRAIIQQWRQAWSDTAGGTKSPPQPW